MGLGPGVQWHADLSRGQCVVGCPPARLLHPAEPCALRYRDPPLPRCCAQPSQSHRGCSNAPCTSQCGEMEAQGVGMRGDPCPGCVIGESSGGGKWAELGWREVVPSLILSRGGGEWNVFLPPPPPNTGMGGVLPSPPTHTLRFLGRSTPLSSAREGSA